MTCARCGLTGTIGFTATRRGPRCHPCLVEEASEAGKKLRWLNIASVGVIVVALSRGAIEVGWLVPIAATVAVGVVVHELGHALVGALLGFRVFGVVVGIGPHIATLRTERLSVELRLVPVGGATRVATRRRRGYRTRHVFVVVGGPVATAAYAVALFAWLPRLGIEPAAALQAASLQVIIAVSNLIPLRSQLNGEAVLTDGGLILDTLRLEPHEIDERIANIDNVTEHDRVERAGRDRVAVLAATADTLAGARVGVGAVHHITALSNDGRWREAADVCRQLLTKPAQAVIRAHVLNTLAWDLAVLQENLEEAERASAEAIELLPWSAAFQGTRGAVLVSLGHLDPGMAWLERGAAGMRAREYRTQPEWPQWAAEQQAFMALGWAKRGNLFEARQALDHARSGAPDFPPVAVAAELIATQAAETLNEW